MKSNKKRLLCLVMVTAMVLGLFYGPTPKSQAKALSGKYYGIDGTGGLKIKVYKMKVYLKGNIMDKK